MYEFSYVLCGDGIDVTFNTICLWTCEFRCHENTRTSERMGICPDEKNARERAEEYYLSSFASAFRSFSFEFLKTNIVIASKAIVIVWTLLFHYHQVNIIESIISLLSYRESTICRILLGFVRWSGDQIRPNIAILSSRHWFFRNLSAKAICLSFLNLFMGPFTSINVM